MKIKIKVTKEILKQSMLCGYGLTDGEEIGAEARANCAISKACQMLLPACETTMNFIIYKDWIINLPNEASTFIQHFDFYRREPNMRLTMSPIEFEVDLPDRIIDAIGINEALQIIRYTNTLELV